MHKAILKTKKEKESIFVGEVSTSGGVELPRLSKLNFR